ncbi:MAG: tetratricopeptide repeat protein [Candidatus Sumerlaeia bacterium]|nr:tetratricopeptide repeat protein [Candidatus Sumerlaeia bacterium]
MPNSTSPTVPKKASTSKVWIASYFAVFLILQIVIILFFGVFTGEKSRQNSMLAKAREHTQLGEHQQSLDIFLEFGEIWKDAYVNQHFNRDLGERYLNVGNYPKAVEHLQKSFELNDRHPNTARLLGLALWNNNQKDEAAEMFTREIKMHKPDDQEAHFHLGLYHYEQKRYKEAFAHFSAVRNDFPDYARLDTLRREFMESTLQLSDSNTGTSPEATTP